MPFAEARKVIENEQFEVAYIFRGSVVAHHKRSGRYFPVWVAGCNHGSEKEISFAEEGKLKIVYESGRVTVMIDLEQPAFAVIKE
jgi:hypothetical protein